MDSSTKFATLLTDCYALQFCSGNRQNIHPTDIVAFFYGQVSGRSTHYIAFRDIAYEQYSRNTEYRNENLFELCKYFYSTVSVDIRRQALASLFLCFDIDIRAIKHLEIIDRFENNALMASRARTGTPLHRLDVILNVLNMIQYNSRANPRVELSDLKLWKYIIYRGAMSIDRAFAPNVLRHTETLASICDDEIVVMHLFAISKQFALAYASDRLKDTETVVIAALKRDASSLISASERLRDNDAIVMAALKEGLIAIHYASDRMKNDIRVIKFGINQTEFASRPAVFMSSVSARLQDNEEVIMAAVTRTGAALEYASHRLRDNEIVVLVAVSNRSDALRFASLRLRDDMNIVKAALASRDVNVSDVLMYASERCANILKRSGLAAGRKRSYNNR